MVNPIELPGPEHTRKLIRLFLKGDNEHYRSIHTSIERFVSRLVSESKDQREELVSVIMTAVFENLQENKFRGDTLNSLYAYILQISRNKVNSWRRKAEHRNLRLGEEYYEDESKLTFYDKIEINDLASLVYNQLDDKCEQMLRLRFEKELEYTEIGNELNMNAGAVRTAVSRCIDKARNFRFVKDWL